METATIRISQKSRNTLKKLAALKDSSMQAVLENAIEAYRRELFLKEVNEGYAKLRKNKREWAAFQMERDFDGTIADGLDSDENWNESGKVTLK